MSLPAGQQELAGAFHPALISIFRAGGWNQIVTPYMREYEMLTISLLMVFAPWQASNGPSTYARNVNITLGLWCDRCAATLRVPSRFRGDSLRWSATTSCQTGLGSSSVGPCRAARTSSPLQRITCTTQTALCQRGYNRPAVVAAHVATGHFMGSFSGD